MTTDLEDLLTRLTDMQEAVVSSSDAVAVAFYAQEAPKYWTNRVDGFTVRLESENLQIITYRITMTLVLATVTEGIEQEAERYAQAQIPVVLQYFGQRRQLKRTVADADVVNLHPLGSLIVAGNVDYGVLKSGVGQPMFAIDFVIEVPMYQQTNQVIW